VEGKLFIFYFCLLKKNKNKMEKVSTTIEDEETKLLRHYQPILFLYSQENYFPCSIDWILHQSGKTQQDLLVSPSLTINPVHYPGQLFSPLSTIPIYGILRRRNHKIYLTYIALFPYNGHYITYPDIWQGFPIRYQQIGQHPGDIEHFTVELDESTKTLSRIWYNRHSPKDGQWVDAKDVEMIRGRPVVYLAWHGHGFFQKPGLYLRFIGNSYMVSFDLCDRGIEWDGPLEILYPKADPRFDPKTMVWTTVQGSFGHAGFPASQAFYGSDGQSLNVPEQSKKYLRIPIVVYRVLCFLLQLFLLGILLWLLPLILLGILCWLVYQVYSSIK